jgi:hypothetical protein
MYFKLLIITFLKVLMYMKLRSQDKQAKIAPTVILGFFEELKKRTAGSRCILNILWRG